MFSIAFLTSCEGTWLMYDTNQKPSLYFEMGSSNDLSFVLLSGDSVEYQIPVKMMGMPKDVDREIKLETVVVDESEILTNAELANDYQLSNLIIPAGAVSGNINIKIFRQAGMMDKTYSVRFKIVENENFLPLTPDSTNIRKILTPEYFVHVKDGELTCPQWWDASTSSQDYFGWSMYLGSFFPEKYKKMLEIFWSVEQTNPVFFADCVERYGRNLDKEEIKKNFFASENAAAWANYVLIPLCDYWQAYYEANPEFEYVETIQIASGTAGKYWRHPLGLLR